MTFVHKCALTAFVDPVFVKGVQAGQPENSLDDVFLLLFFSSSNYFTV